MQPPSPDMEAAYLKSMRQTALFVRAGVTLGIILLVFTLGLVVNLSNQTREATTVNRRLIERGNPCISGDPPDSEACIAKAASDARLADALAAVQAQHDRQAQQIAEQGRQLTDAIDRLVELQERQHGSIPNAGARLPTRPATRTTVVPSTTTTAATTPPEGPTSTKTCVPHKRERCK